MEEKDTWLSDIIETLYNLGGEAHYSDIYKEAKRLRTNRGATWPESGEAITRRVLEEQSSDSQSFKGKDIFYSAEGIRKGIWGLRRVVPDFQIGQIYNRQKDIHDRFGGSRQSGISPCRRTPYIFLFTGSSGEQFGYEPDDWDDEGIFNYTGEGQIGDMQFSDGNKAIRDHIPDGRDLLLFRSLGKGKGHRFMGQFICLGYQYKETLDREQKPRKSIIFQLKNVDEEQEDEIILARADEKPKNLIELREKAYHAVSQAKEGPPSAGKRTYYERNKDVKAYVLARANGSCECCGAPAPFIRKDGTPYLEPHHIYKLSDKGEDSPQLIAALTPNCHREIHHGKNGEQIDRRLEKAIKEKEENIKLRGAA